MTSKTTMVLEINELKAKLKAKDEEFIKLLDDELEKIEYTFKNLDTLYEDLDSCDEEYEKTIHTHQLEGRRFCIEEIKQRIKEE